MVRRGTGGGRGQNLRSGVRGLPRRKFGRRGGSGAEEGILATVVWRREAADGVGRDKKPHGTKCRDNVRHATIARPGRFFTPAKRSSRREATASGYKRA